MPGYAAFLGHQPHISLAELRATVPDLALEALIRPREGVGGSRDIALFGTASTIAPAYLATLGGTIAIAEKLDAGDASLDDLPRLLAQQVKDVRGKVTFSIRAAGLPPKKVRDLYRRCKDHLRKQGRIVRYVGSDRAAAAPVLLRDEGLMDGKRGCELTVVAGKGEGKEGGEEFLWIGRTLAAQDVEAYAKRDVGKPVRDMTAGLLPPKLAQILLNFGAWLVRMQGGQAPAALTVLDPFCGTGVIPLECLLRRWNVLASDLSLKAVNGATKNIEWLRKEAGVRKSDALSRVWKQDARKPFELKAKERPDVIVTETTLGPPLSKRPTLKEVQSHRRESEELQEAFLANAAATLQGVPIVATWPVWYLRKEQVRLQKIWEKLHTIGYGAAMPAGIALSPGNRPSLLYRRPDQFVGREIVLLRPVRR